MKYRLDELSIIKRGGSPRPITDYLANEGLPWLKISDFNYGERYVYNSHEFIIPKGLNKTKLVKKNTLIVTNSATPGIPIFLGKDMCLHDGFLYFESISDKVLPMYLYYFLLKQRDFLKSQGNGSIFINLKKEILERTIIDLPDIENQNHIVNIIGTIDDLIEYKQKIIDKLKEYSTLLYKGYSAIESINKINLGDCCTIKTGKINADQAVINGKYFFFTCGKEVLYINDYVFNCKAIIISGNGEISVKYYDGKFNAYQRTYVLEPQKYFYIFLKECELSIEDLKMNSQGSVIKFITKGMLEKISISINDNSNILNEKLKNIYNDISIINNEIRLLNKIKTKLLAKYF